MSRILLALFMTAGLIGLAPATDIAYALDDPVHDLAVSGVGVTMYPAFDSSTERYAITTTAATDGSVTVAASTSDPAGRVLVNGRPVVGGSSTVHGLEPGDEVSVIFRDSARSTAHSLIYLPSGFPELTAEGDPSTTAPGMVGLTLTKWAGDPAPSFETAVDALGVPVYVRAVAAGTGTYDLKRQPNGRYSVSRTTETPGRTGSVVVELDPAFREIARHETVGLLDTDLHDSILQPDGSQILIAYEPNEVTGLIDSVIQEVDSNGKVVFEWSSADLVEETIWPPGHRSYDDYAHINSVFVMRDGDLLASFRNLSSVLKIARRAHDGYQPGDIVWRLGGRRSDFRFADDPYAGGPCAQHTATELPNGNILLFDNGSAGGAFGELCIDPADPSGPAVARRSSRAVEYELDVREDPATLGTARLVWSHEPGWLGWFAGSSQRLANGNTLIGWTDVPHAVATEVNGDGDTVWKLTSPADAQGRRYSSYRAAKFEVPDAIAPQVDISVPADGATYFSDAPPTVDWHCTDRGGSTLQSCDVSGAVGTLLDTRRAGHHTLVVQAMDGAGNTTRVTRTYTVAVARRPDFALKVARSGRPWTGNDVYGGPRRQTVTQNIDARVPTATFKVRLQNDGDVAERMHVKGAGGGRNFAVVYRVGGRDITRAVRAGTYRTARLQPHEQLKMTVRVTRTKVARTGDTRTVKLKASSRSAPTIRDVVGARVRVVR